MNPFFADEDDFPKADVEERGCGKREPGGVYAEAGLARRGSPLETFLFDPPLPLPAGLNLINKPRLWPRLLSDGVPALDEDGEPIVDLLIWVGAQYYPYCPDFLEEVRRQGASRRLNPHLDLSRLSRASRMILAHPRALNTRWQEQRPPQECHKRIAGHSIGEREQGKEHTGSCLSKLWELIPAEAAQSTVVDQAETDAPPLCLRAIGSTLYPYRPTGEDTEGLVPGLFAALPLTGVALVRRADGSVQERAKQSLLAGRQKHGRLALPFSEPDC